MKCKFRDIAEFEKQVSVSDMEQGQLFAYTCSGALFMKLDNGIVDITNGFYYSKNIDGPVIPYKQLTPFDVVQDLDFIYSLSKKS